MKIFVAVAVILFIAKQGQSDVCPSKDEDKIDCGYYGITAEQCAGRDCCWEKSDVYGVPWCSLPVACAVEAEDREDCAEFGINKEECEKNSCCWLPAYVEGINVPWCFKQNIAPATAAPAPAPAAPASTTAVPTEKPTEPEEKPLQVQGKYRKQPLSELQKIAKLQNWLMDLLDDSDDN